MGTNGPEERQHKLNCRYIEDSDFGYDKTAQTPAEEDSTIPLIAICTQWRLPKEKMAGTPRVFHSMLAQVCGGLYDS